MTLCSRIALAVMRAKRSTLMTCSDRNFIANSLLSISSDLEIGGGSHFVYITIFDCVSEILLLMNYATPSYTVAYDGQYCMFALSECVKVILKISMEHCYCCNTSLFNKHSLFCMNCTTWYKYVILNKLKIYCNHMWAQSSIFLAQLFAQLFPGAYSCRQIAISSWLTDGWKKLKKRKRKRNS